MDECGDALLLHAPLGEQAICVCPVVWSGSRGGNLRHVAMGRGVAFSSFLFSGYGEFFQSCLVGIVLGGRAVCRWISVVGKAGKGGARCLGCCFVGVGGRGGVVGFTGGMGRRACRLRMVVAGCCP